MSSIQGFNFDKEKLDHLLKLFQQGRLSQEEALALKHSLEGLHKEASDKGDLNLARNIASILLTLKGVLGGRISLVENVPIADKVSMSVS
ncbi:hypothetical protein BH18THE2_BH18THE2_25110 [soil metagenome]